MCIIDHLQKEKIKSVSDKRTDREKKTITTDTRKNLDVGSQNMIKVTNFRLSMERHSSGIKDLTFRIFVIK